MALATRCPACETVFRISTAQAAAKGGMVRCGQCRNVFNSLDALVRVEDLEVIDELAVDPPAVAAASTDDADLVDAIETGAADAAMVFAAPDDLDPAMPARAEAPHHPMLDEGPPTEWVVSASADPPAETSPAEIREWWLPAPNEAQRPGRTSLSEIEAPSIAASRGHSGALLSGRRTDLPPTVDVGTGPAFLRPEEAPAPSGRAARWVFGLLSLLAAVLLAGQAVYLWRDEIAARWSPARPWLTAACVPLKCRVDYPMHPDAITIESASIQATGANLNVYVLTALLRNRDGVDIRYPLLDLVLTDVQDRPIFRRALRPEDYLDAGRNRASGFAADSELPIRVTFELSDLRFAGYRLEKATP